MKLLEFDFIKSTNRADFLYTLKSELVAKNQHKYELTIPKFVYIVFFVWVVIGFELRAFHLQSRYSTI
jgi:hypothetical protein